MPLNGDVKTFPLAAIVQMVHDERKTGILAVSTPRRRMSIYFREGKITLPVLLAYRRGTDEERVFWKESIEDGKNDEGRLEHARALMAKHGALADTIARAKHFGAIAHDALGPFKQSPFKNALLDVVEFCVSRVN